MTTDPEKKLHVFTEKDTFAKHLGIEIVKMEDGYAVVSMPFDERHKNGMGQTHGGAIFALADMSFAAASNAYDTVCVNAQSSISYIAPGREGPLTGVAQRVHEGRRLVTYEVKIHDATQTLVAIATITGYQKKIS